MLKDVLKRAVPRTLQPIVRDLYFRHQVRSFKPHTVERRFGKQKLQILIADEVGQEWYGKDWAELPELELLGASSLKPGATVFDLGAHQAVVALLLADAVQPGGRVIALEANPHNAEVAAKNVEMNRGNVTVLNCAAAAENGTITFNKSLNGQADSAMGDHGFNVPARSVDSLAAEYGAPDLVFIDVEGFELEVLKGASVTSAGVCDFFVEVHGGCGLEKFGGSNEGLLAHFPEDRYDRYYSDEGKGSFVRLDERALREGTRWFLVAIDRRRPA